MFEKKTVKHSVQYHVFAQSPPGRRPNDKYPIKTSQLSDLFKNVSLFCYLVTTVIHIQSVGSQICLYMSLPGKTFVSPQLWAVLIPQYNLKEDMWK